MKALHPDWTKNEADPVEFERLVRNSVVLDKLLKIIDRRLQELENQEISVSQYDSPAWAEKTAHRFGQKQELMRQRQLLQHLTQEA